MGLSKKNIEKKNYTISGKQMNKAEFAQLLKDSEESGEVDFDKGIEQVNERLEEYRKLKKK